jgi:hypothetical protein
VKRRRAVPRSSATSRSLTSASQASGRSYHAQARLPGKNEEAVSTRSPSDSHPFSRQQARTRPSSPPPPPQFPRGRRRSGPRWRGGQPFTPDRGDSVRHPGLARSRAFPAPPGPPRFRLAGGDLSAVSPFGSALDNPRLPVGATQFGVELHRFLPDQMPSKARPSLKKGTALLTSTCRPESRHF